MDEEKKQRIGAIDTNQVERQIARYTGWLVAATIALGAFTAILAYFTYQMSSDSGKQVALTDTTFKEQRRYDSTQISRIDSQLSLTRQSLRAYVIASCPKVVLTDHGLLPFDFTFVNEGETPAYDILASFSIKTGTTRTINFSRYTQKSKRFAPLGRFDGAVMGQIPIEVATGIEEIPRLKSDIDTIFFWGMITYRDISEGHDTTFWRIQSYWDNQTGALCQFQWCKDGNRAN